MFLTQLCSQPDDAFPFLMCLRCCVFLTTLDNKEGLVLSKAGLSTSRSCLWTSGTAVFAARTRLLWMTDF